MREPSARERSRALFQGRFLSIDDLTAALGAELNQITDRWRAYRGTQRVDRASYRAAQRAAHVSMRELGNASGAAWVLREGLACTEAPAVQEACAAMVATLAIRIDVDPELPLIVCSRPRADAAAGQVS